jgi:hypothetical protein
MRRRNIFYKTIINGKEDIREKDSDMCFAMIPQKIDLDIKSRYFARRERGVHRDENVIHTSALPAYPA